MENEIVESIETALKSGARFISFLYDKGDGNPPERRNILVGAKVAAAQEKRGNLINGKGNWHSGHTKGRNNFAVERNGIVYIRGYDMAEQANNGKAGTLKIFTANRMSDIRGVN